jgi:hypothetical protein
VRARCDALVGRVVRSTHVHNRIVGVQLMFDWRRDEPSFGCHLIEVNVRPSRLEPASYRHRVLLSTFPRMAGAAARLEPADRRPSPDPNLLLLILHRLLLPLLLLLL